VSCGHQNDLVIVCAMLLDDRCSCSIIEPSIVPNTLNAGGKAGWDDEKKSQSDSPLLQRLVPDKPNPAWTSLHRFGLFREIRKKHFVNDRKNMHTQHKCLIVMILLSLIGFGPISLTCLMGLYVVIARPTWFLRVTRNLYLRSNSLIDASTDSSGSSNSSYPRIKTFVSLMTLLILDIAPVPVTGFIGLIVVINRPPWFKNLVEGIYAGS